MFLIYSDVLSLVYSELCFFFFFSSRRRHTRYWRDWSSDVCSSDLMLCRTRSSSHTVAACCGCTNIPHPAGELRRPGPFFQSASEASRHFGSATWIRDRKSVV